MKMGLNSACPYQSFASVYDEYLAHVDYSMWAKYILDLWGENRQIGPLSALDIACGTGKMLNYLASKNVKFSAFDNSPHMVEKAELNLKEKWQYIDFIGVGDMRTFQSNTTFDLCCCSFDSINYLLKKNDIERFFNNTLQLLNDGGVFIFDAATPYLCLEYYDGTSENTQIGEIIVERSSVFDGKSNLLLTEFNFTNDITNEKKNEKHEQKIYTHNELVFALKKSGYKDIQYYSDFSLQPGMKADALRIHFRAEK